MILFHQSQILLVEIRSPAQLLGLIFSVEIARPFFLARSITSLLALECSATMRAARLLVAAPCAFFSAILPVSTSHPPLLAALTRKFLSFALRVVAFGAAVALGDGVAASLF